MDTIRNLNRQTKFALMSALAAGFVSSIMLFTFFDFLSWLFLPSVMAMVFVSANFAFRRQMHGKGTLTGRRIFHLGLEVGSVSHFYTFAFYFPLQYFLTNFQGVNWEIVGAYFIITLVVSIVSVLMFVWIAVPMYVGVGYLLMYFEKDAYRENRVLNDDIIDDIVLTD